MIAAAVNTRAHTRAPIIVFGLTIPVCKALSRWSIALPLWANEIRLLAGPRSTTQKSGAYKGFDGFEGCRCMASADAFRGGECISGLLRSLLYSRDYVQNNHLKE